jgi:hypothetical protein
VQNSDGDQESPKNWSSWLISIGDLDTNPNAPKWDSLVAPEHVDITSV